jgi:hypothetical protein
MNFLKLVVFGLLVSSISASINLELNGAAAKNLDLSPGGNLTFTVDGSSLGPGQFFSVLYAINQYDCMIQSTQVTSPSISPKYFHEFKLQSPFGSLYSTTDVYIDYARSEFTITIYGMQAVLLVISIVSGLSFRIILSLIVAVQCCR